MKYDPYTESLSDRLWKLANISILGAGLSASIWCAVWVVGFFTVVIASARMGLPTETSAMVISLTVLLGHLPKFVAIFLGTDTDFQDFRDQVGEFDLRHVPWTRVGITVALILTLIVFTIPERADNMSVAVEPTDLNAFASVTLENIYVCMLLFAIQYVFSYPKDINEVDGRVLNAKG